MIIFDFVYKETWYFTRKYQLGRMVVERQQSVSRPLPNKCEYNVLDGMVRSQLCDNIMMRLLQGAGYFKRFLHFGDIIITKFSPSVGLFQRLT